MTLALGSESCVPLPASAGLCLGLRLSFCYPKPLQHLKSLSALVDEHLGRIGLPPNTTPLKHAQREVLVGPFSGVMLVSRSLTLVSLKSLSRCRV